MLKVFPLVSWEERKEKRDQLVLIKGLFFFFFLFPKLSLHAKIWFKEH